jgi:hypothetical protein
MLLSIGKFQLTGQASCLESFLFLSVQVCEAVVLLYCVWYRAGVQCVCVCVCWKCFLLNRVYIFSTSAKYVSWKKCHRMFGKKYVMLTMPCERTVYRIEFWAVFRYWTKGKCWNSLTFNLNGNCRMKNVPLFSVDSDAKVNFCSYCHESVNGQWIAWCATHLYLRWVVVILMLECIQILVDIGGLKAPFISWISLHYLEFGVWCAANGQKIIGHVFFKETLSTWLMMAS